MSTPPTAKPSPEKSQGTGHGANPTPDTGAEPAPTENDEHFAKERVPSTDHDGGKTPG